MTATILPLVSRVEMARVIVKALYGYDHLPSANNPEVQRRAKGGTHGSMLLAYRLALSALEEDHA